MQSRNAGGPDRIDPARLMSCNGTLRRRHEEARPLIRQCVLYSAWPLDIANSSSGERMSLCRPTSAK